MVQSKKKVRLFNLKKLISAVKINVPMSKWLYGAALQPISSVAMTDGADCGGLLPLKHTRRNHYDYSVFAYIIYSRRACKVLIR